MLRYVLACATALLLAACYREDDATARSWLLRPTDLPGWSEYPKESVKVEGCEPSDLKGRWGRAESGYFVSGNLTVYEMVEIFDHRQSLFDGNLPRALAKWPECGVASFDGATARGEPVYFTQQQKREGELLSPLLSQWVLVRYRGQLKDETEVVVHSVRQRNFVLVVVSRGGPPAGDVVNDLWRRACIRRYGEPVDRDGDRNHSFEHCFPLASR